MNKDLDRLQHMCEACELLLRATSGNYADYADSRDRQASVERYFEILGEASKNISDELKKNHPELPWRIAGDIRNFIAHEYVKVNCRRLWETALHDIPMLFLQVRHLLGLYGDGWTPCTDFSVHPDDQERIAHIVKSIEHCNAMRNEYLGKPENDQLKLNAAIRNITVIGEAASQLTRDFRKTHAAIDWSSLISYSDRLLREYANVDAADVWETINCLQQEQPFFTAMLTAKH